MIGFSIAEPPRSAPYVFKGSFLGAPTRVSDFYLDFSTECRAETTIYNVMTAAGVSLKQVGAKYILAILTEVVNGCLTLVHAKDFYRIAERLFGVKAKTIEISIMRALAAAGMDQLLKLNTILGGIVVQPKDSIGAGEFLNNVATRLLMLKSHQSNRVYFAWN